MRIISGKFKSKRFQAPKNLPVRPTTDMAKEALFNILNNLYYFNEVSVLDLFSGTGNISYEFISRGCETITAVDANAGCTKFIQKISQELEVPIQIIKTDVFKYLEKSKTTFDIIFADPPYEMPQEKFEQIITLIFDNKLLNEGGLLILEHSKHTHLNQHSLLAFQKKYGGNMFSFFEANENALQ